jgi:hypothetical protein
MRMADALTQVEADEDGKHRANLNRIKRLSSNSQLIITADNGVKNPYMAISMREVSVFRSCISFCQEHQGYCKRPQ